MRTLWSTGFVLFCALAAQSAFGATLGTQLNIYADSYAPVQSRTITVTAQFADAKGLPVNDSSYTTFTAITVNWSVSNGAYGITASSSTNALGYATATLTVPASAGQSCTVTASGGGYSATSNTITSIAAAGVATKYLVTLSNYEPVLSGGTTVTAQLADANNNPVGTSGRTVTWSKTGSGGAFGSGTSTTIGSGVATVTFTAGASMTTYVISGNDGTFSGTALPATTCVANPSGNDVETTPVPYFLDYNRIQTIFGKCTGCHTSGGQTPYYDPGTSYGNTVNVVGVSSGLKYFNPSDAGTSYIFRKAHEGTPPGGGVRMPQGGPYLNAAEQQIIRDWINQGAVNRSVSNFQVTVTGTGVPSPAAGAVVTVSAQLRDSTNTAIKVPGMLVSWSKTGTLGAFASASTRTDANGIATVTFTTDTVSGRTYTFTATSSTLTGTSSSITTVAGPATNYTLGLSTTNPVAGNPVTVSAQLVDQYNNNVSAVRTITWSHSNGASGATFGSPTSTTVAGFASVTFTSSTTAGLTETVTATDAPYTSTSAAITTKFAQYLVTAVPAGPYTVGQTITLTAQLADGGGTALPQAGQSVTFSASAPGGTFTPSTAQLTNASGNVSVSFKTSNTSGSITVTATDGTANGTLLIVNNPGPATKYIVTVSSTTPTVNTAITADAQLSDALNNPVPTSGLVVTWTAPGKGGTFTTSPTTTDSSGHCSLTFTPSTSAGLSAITATDTVPHTGFINITSQADVPVKYVMTAASSMTVGSAGNAVTAQLSDTYNNPVSQVKTVTWGTSGVGGTFTSPTSVTNGSGLASVNFTASTTAGSLVLTSTDGTNTGSTGTITVNPGPANKYIVTASTSLPVAGSGVTVNAQLTDSFGNALTTSGLVVNWSLTAGVGGSFSSLSSNTVSGLATVTYTTSTTAGTLYTVKATEGAHVGSVSFTSIAGTAVQCPLIVTPTNPVAGGTVAVSGQIKDVNGNNVATPGIVIIWSSDASGAFAQGTSTSNASGQVSVNFTTGPKANVAYNLTATDGLAITGTAATFTSQTGAASAYTVSVSTTSPVVGGAVTVSAQLVDINGNAVATAGQVVTWTPTGAIGNLATPTSLTNAAGVATVLLTATTISGTSGTVSATTGASTGVSPLISTLSGPAAKYVVSASSTSVSAGTAVRVSAQLIDASGNAVTTSGTTVTWSLTGANGFLSTPTSDTNNAGMATVVLSTSPSGAVTYVVSASDAGGITGTGPTITVAAAPAVTGVSPLITSPLTAETAVGAPFSYAITATGDQPIVFDATNLPVGLTLSGDTITGATFGSGTFVVHVTASNAFGTDSIDLVIVSSPLQALSVDKAAVKLNFAVASGDALSAMFTLTLPDGTSAQNAVVSVQFGAASFANMTAASKLKLPRAKGPAGPSAAIAIKAAVKGSSSFFVTLTVKNSNFKDALAANGLINATVSTTVHVPVVVTMKTDSGTFYCGGDAALKYKATQGKSGSATR